MTPDEATKEFELDCKIRHLSPKTIDNYGKQLRYLQRFLEKEFSISTIEDVKNVSITQRYLEGITDEGMISIARKTGVLENIQYILSTGI